MQVAELRFGSDGVDLTHVPPFVLLLHVADMQEPRAVFVVSHRDSGIPGDHVTVHRQDGRLLEVHPSHLRDKVGVSFW